MGRIQYCSPLRCNWSLIGDTAMIDLIWIVLLLVICAAILGGIVGWCLARVNLYKEIEEAKWQGSKEYFDASQDYESIDIET